MRGTLGDVRGSSLGDYWPLSAMPVIELGETKWIVVDLTENVNAQMQKAIRFPSCEIAENYMVHMKS